MHLNRLIRGEKIAAVSAIVLFVSMFLDWFAVKIPESIGVEYFIDGTGQSAWDALNCIPIVLTITVVAVLIVVVWRFTNSAYEPPVPLNAVVAILGIVSALLILFRIVDPPSFGSFPGFFSRTAPAERTVQFGIFLGLLAAAGIAFGGYRAMREESAGLQQGRRD